MVAAIDASGVQVIGELDILAAGPARAAGSEAQSPPPTRGTSLPWDMRAILLLLRATEPLAMRRRRPAPSTGERRDGGSASPSDPRIP